MLIMDVAVDQIEYDSQTDEYGILDLFFRWYDESVWSIPRITLYQSMVRE